MILPPFHQRLVEAARGVCDRYGLALAGGYAMKAHGFTDRPSQDLAFATECETPLPEVAEAVAEDFRGQGFVVEVLEFNQRWGRMVISDPISEQACEFDLLRESLRDRPVTLDLCRVVGQDDAVGLKVRALHGRGVPRDFIDVASVAHLYSFRELERLGALHDDEWQVEDLAQRLEAVDLLAEEAFLAYGITEEQLRAVKRFAYSWVEDIKLRRADDGDIDFDDPDLPDLD